MASSHLSPSDIRKVVDYVFGLVGTTQAAVVGVVKKNPRGETTVIPAIEGSSWWGDLAVSPMFVQKYDYQIHVAIYYPEDVLDGYHLLDIHDSSSYEHLYTFRIR
jgi:hypothetical protein